MISSISNLSLQYLGPGPYIRILDVHSDMDSQNFTGFGKINLTCTVEGNNATRVYWIRTNKNGDNGTLSVTAMEKMENTIGNLPTLKTSLLDRPKTNKFPFIYQCVVENYCCLTRTSSPVTIHRSPLPGKLLFSMKFVHCWNFLFVFSCGNCLQKLKIQSGKQEFWH